MNRFPFPRRTALAAALAVVALAALAGCAKKVTSVAAGYTSLPGRYDPAARLYAWVEWPDTIVTWADLHGSPGPPTDPDNNPDTLLAHTPFYNLGPSVVHMLIVDGTNAKGFQFFRRAANGGLQAMADYTIPPTTMWLPSGFEDYALVDRSPGGFSPPTYVARGLLGGSVTTQSPVTAEVSLSPVPPRQSIRMTATATPKDSLFHITWTPAIGATGYWLHVYQFKNTATQDERLRSGLPTPILDGNVKSIFIGYVAGGSASDYKLGSPGAQVLLASAPLRNQVYMVRVTGVDDAGHVVAWMKGDSQLVIDNDFQYSYYPLGAVAVTPQK